MSELNEPKKLTTREVTDSRMLMIMISQRPGEQAFGRTVERITRTVETELKAAGRDMPVYDVRVSINGVDLDFRDFASEVQRQLDDMVMREAGELLKQIVSDKLDDLMHEAHESITRLNDGVRKKAAELLGYNPWRDE